ncbi:MAG TPA: hypothetical protein VFA20_19995 [Myxococcaceae bacterium]|nr:hypothetical protein [Myxococcaceae bacterium]
MDGPPTTDALSPGLRQVLESIQDRTFAARLRKVYLAAAHAVLRLSDMDLVRYETTSVDEAPDLSLWEEMAPVIRDTVMDVNALLQVIRENFPQNVAGGLADVVEKAVNETVSPAKPDDAVAVLHSVMGRLAQQVTELGEGMRKPEVVSDRWNLLSEIQRFRTRFRHEIGTLVHQSASVFADVHQKDVVPGYVEEVASAVSIRATASDLVRVVEARIEKIHEAEPEDTQWHAQQLEKELDLFGKTPAYRALRAQDKRAIVEFRGRLGVMASRPTQKRELEEAVLPFGQLCRGLLQVNNRVILQQHDREVLAGCGVKLEQADQALQRMPEDTAALLSEAVLSAQELYGRDPQLDVFLRKARKLPVSALPPEQLRDTLEQFRSLLAGLPVI